MDKLTTAEVCQILERCALSGVEAIAWRGLAVTFRTSSTQPWLPETVLPGMDAQVGFATLAKQEQDIKQDQLERMVLEDPGQMEDLLAKAEFDGED